VNSQKRINKICQYFLQLRSRKFIFLQKSQRHILLLHFIITFFDQKGKKMYTEKMVLLKDLKFYRAGYILEKQLLNYQNNYAKCSN